MGSILGHNYLDILARSQRHVHQKKNVKIRPKLSRACSLLASVHRKVVKTVQRSKFLRAKVTQLACKSDLESHVTTLPPPENLLTILCQFCERQLRLASRVDPVIS